MATKNQNSKKLKNAGLKSDRSSISQAEMKLLDFKIGEALKVEAFNNFLVIPKQPREVVLRLIDYLKEV